MEYGFLAAGVAIWGLLWLLIFQQQARQMRSVQQSNQELAATLGEIARVEHGVPPATEPMTAKELNDYLNAAAKDIYGSVPQMAFPRAETLDDPSLEADPNQLGEWDVPPGLLDAAGDEDMT